MIRFACLVALMFSFLDAVPARAQDATLDVLDGETLYEGGWLVTVKMYGVSPHEYWDFTASFINWWEPVSGLIKCVFFGASIGLISCYKGFNCSPGAAGVGRAATEAFVTSFLTIIVLNLILAQLLNTINVTFVDKGVITAFG